MDEKSVYMSKDSKICIANKQGVVKQILNLEGQIYGNVVNMEIKQTNLLVLTSFSYVLSYDISRREIKSPSDIKNLSEYGYEEVKKVGNDLEGRFLTVLGLCNGQFRILYCLGKVLKISQK